MGVYLSSPVTEKNSIDEECRNFVYGASSMQGWRITQEDAHNCIPVFDEKTKTSFFAVYDGHGGSEVAKYCERHFPDFVKKMMESADGTGDDPTHLIQNAFLAFDATLTNDDVIKELKELAGKDDDIEEDEDDDPVGRTETDMLKEEANMPLDQLLAQYKSSTAEDIKNASKNENFQSPALEAKVSSSDAGTSSQDAKNGPSSDSSVFISSSSSSSSATLTESDNAGSGSVSNGVSNKNNSYNPSQSQNPDNMTVNNNDMDNNPGDNNNIDTVADSTNSNVCESETGEAQSSTPQKKKGKSQSASTDGQAPGGSKGKSSNSLSSSSSSSTSQAGGNASGAGSSANSIDGPSGSGTSQHSGERSSKAKAAVDMANMDGAMDTSDDDDDEDEDEDAWEDMSEDDDEDDDDEEEEDHDEDVPMMDMTNEEPGSDSGCTACVALMQGKKLIVANAGDSRCILSRAGKAIELSFDHKPEDDCERERIEKAGGKVTADGRVNGGLNLSRAIGDHVYKRNKDLPAREQMITALPDIETAELGEEDQFIVIACDGIWNYMSSQEVVDYVLEKLKDPMKRKAPSVICEELFDHCLAPNTFGDGTGCDNMTCIIIILDTFKPTETQVANTEAAAVGKDEKNKEVEEEEDSLLSQQSEEETGPGTLKRCADNVDVNQSKRLKVEEEVA